MGANDRQVGGSHYQGHSIQHWDLMIKFNVPYIIGCASKYLWRWKKKNGVQDLEKAQHYLQKAIESWDKLPSYCVDEKYITGVARIEQWGHKTTYAVWCILCIPNPTNYRAAIEAISILIAKQGQSEQPKAASLHPA